VSKDPLEILKQLQDEPFKFKLKGSQKIDGAVHLGCGFNRDKDGVLTMDPEQYINLMEDAYKQRFNGETPTTKETSPLDPGDHPELDTSEFLDEDGVEIYQSLIGSMQWAISIGRWDIQTAVMTLSSFCAFPRVGHLQRVKRMYAYLIKFRYFKIRFDVREPNYESVTVQKYDWDNTAYGNGSEDLPTNAPTPKGKRVVLTHYFDANLMHDVLSGMSVTGIFHMANMTPMIWYSKKAATNETATYGAEFLAARTCMKHIVDLRNSFRYLGVPVCETSYVWGENESQIKSNSIPYAKLNKRHNILSYHFV
jgi:hypothetical protein